MVKREYVPRRGDIIWTTLDPTRGHKQKRRRPALVLSPVEYTVRAGLLLACPLTKQINGYPFEVPFVFKNARCAILVDQVRSINWHERNAAFIKKCNRKVLVEVLEKLRLLLE